MGKGVSALCSFGRLEVNWLVEVLSLFERTVSWQLTVVQTDQARKCRSRRDGEQYHCYENHVGQIKFATLGGLRVHFPKTGFGEPKSEGGRPASTWDKKIALGKWTRLTSCKTGSKLVLTEKTYASDKAKVLEGRSWLVHWEEQIDRLSAKLSPCLLLTRADPWAIVILTY